jgi:hypothetical protein
MNNYIYFDKSTPLLTLLTDFINSKILICGVSSLSQVCTFLGEHELIIIPDNSEHVFTKEAIEISSYINKNSTI